MLLCHSTKIETLKNIYNDDKLYPSCITLNKNQNPYDFYLKYLFFYTIPDNEALIKTQNSSLTFYFDSNILANKTFYTNKLHSAGNLESSKKYEKYNKYINIILKKLFINSYKKLCKTFK